MLGKTELLRSLNGFDDRYFLYFEDFDLCRRAKRLGEIVYLPSLSIEHLGGNTAAKGLRHIGLFLSSAFKYFNRWGWKLY
jgi:GT2 family glycosyltransferase